MAFSFVIFLQDSEKKEENMFCKYFILECCTKDNGVNKTLNIFS